MSEFKRDFPRSFESLPALVAFVDEALHGTNIAPAQRHVLDFAMEELFTNMVKYAPNGAPQITITISRLPQGAEVSLLDRDVDCFDVTRAPDAAVDRPLAERTPGGLGLHVLRRQVDHLSYRYDPQRREGLTLFSVSFEKPPGPPC